MTQKSKSGSTQPKLQVDGEVVRQIRQHARSSTKAEICGVLIGQDRDGLVRVTASITGMNAEEAGAHVTFTQDTWEHIYKVKDSEFPNERIVGWYHSHPGFGVFLSEHDTFIHKNFFSSPGQVAWVFDPLSDEEGCFGWVNGRIERLSQITVSDRRGGERADENAKSEPTYSSPNESEDEPIRPFQGVKSRPVAVPDDEPDDSSLQRLVATFFSYLTAILAGFFLSWYLFPRVVIMPVPVDPRTGKPLTDSVMEMRDGDSDRLPSPNPTKPDAGSGKQQSSPAGSSGNKGENAQPR
jgi:proteasome lid subunit RPN8/RPN11